MRNISTFSGLFDQQGVSSMRPKTEDTSRDTIPEISCQDIASRRLTVVDEGAMKYCSSTGRRPHSIRSAAVCKAVCPCARQFCRTSGNSSAGESEECGRKQDVLILPERCVVLQSGRKGVIPSAAEVSQLWQRLVSCSIRGLGAEGRRARQEGVWHPGKGTSKCRVW